MVLREIFGGEMEKLTGGWRKLQWALRECDFWCGWDGTEKWKFPTVCMNMWKQYVVLD
jgi:hypothetical protein